MQIPLPSACLIFHILTRKCGTFAFLRSQPPSLRLGTSTTVFSIQHLQDADDDSSFDAETARRQLEGLLIISAHPFRDEDDFPSSGWHSVLPFLDSLQSPSLESNHLTHAPPSRVEIELPPVPFLTARERERRSVEITLLKGLAEGENGVEDLSDLWFQERGSKAAARLWKAEQLIAERAARWDDAERELRKLVHEYGVYWVEPIYRLAMLMILQKRWIEAEKMFLIVLAVKPWHMGALSGIVMTYAALQDNKRATEWAAHRLPKFTPGGPNHRRSIWSRAAVKLAQDSLFDAEEHLKDMFGARDTHHSILRCRSVFFPDNGISFWQ